MRKKDLEKLRMVVEQTCVEQHSIRKRIYICIPVFGVTLALLWYNIADADGFNVIWNYFGWANQTLAVFTLWTITVYLVRKKKNYWITLLPAMFMTAVCLSFLLISKDSFGLPTIVGYISAIAAFIISGLLFAIWKTSAGKSMHN